MFQIGEKFSFSSVAAVFSTLEKFISKRVLSMFSHEFTSQHRLLSPTKNKEYRSGKWIFKMNNKHFHTQNRHLLKHDGLVCKIYVLSFNSPLHRSLAEGKNHGLYENNAKSLLTIIIQLEGIRKEVYLCMSL